MFKLYLSNVNHGVRSKTKTTSLIGHFVFNLFDFVFCFLGMF